MSCAPHFPTQGCQSLGIGKYDAVGVQLLLAGVIRGLARAPCEPADDSADRALVPSQGCCRFMMACLWTVA